MAKDDYFVLAFRLLSYLYACLKEGKRPDMEYLSYDTRHFPIGEEYWNYLLVNLHKESFITGVSIVSSLGQVEQAKITRHLQITPKGIEYLAENSMMQKAKAALKEFKDIIPGL